MPLPEQLFSGFRLRQSSVGEPQPSSEQVRRGARRLKYYVLSEGHSPVLQFEHGASTTCIGMLDDPVVWLQSDALQEGCDPQTAKEGR
jgi:hypothetical protein